MIQHSGFCLTVSFYNWKIANKENNLKVHFWSSCREHSRGLSGAHIIMYKKCSGIYVMFFVFNSLNMYLVSSVCPMGKYGPDCTTSSPYCENNCDAKLGYCINKCGSWYGPFCISTTRFCKF